MCKLIYTYDDDGEKTKEIREFETREQALEFAKKEYFDPKSDWYADDPDLPEIYEVDTVKEVAEIDFKEFCKKNKFNFEDCYLYATLKLQMS